MVWQADRVIFSELGVVYGCVIIPVLCPCSGHDRMVEVCNRVIKLSDMQSLHAFTYLSTDSVIDIVKPSVSRFELSHYISIVR